MTNWEHMAALVASLPDLPGAKCKGRAVDLFDLTIGGRRETSSGKFKTTSKAELENARSEALNVCAACPELLPLPSVAGSATPVTAPARRGRRPGREGDMTTPHELDEWRSVVEDLDDAELAANCGHNTCRGRNGTCIHCGDAADP
jgi:hypothetical protein